MMGTLIIGGFAHCHFFNVKASVAKPMGKGLVRFCRPDRENSP